MKNKDMNKFIKKSSIEIGLVIVLAALNILTMAFTVIKGGTEYLSGAEFYYSNGFTLAFEGYPVIVEGFGSWLRAYCVIHFVLSIALCIWLGLFALIKRSLIFGRLGIFSVVASASLSVLYFVHGIIAYSAASDYAGLYYECYTAAFVPFIIAAILTAAFFLVKYKAPDEIELP